MMNSIEIERQTKKINIAFCFDGNLWMQAGVAIASLLHHSKDKCSYHIYCVVSEDINQIHRSELENIMRAQDPESSIIFLEANHDFDQSYFDKFTVAIYYRLMLPQLLPHLDKIIYSDVDVIFCNDMGEADQIDLGDHLIAGVKDTFNLSKAERRKKRKWKPLDDRQYLCSGFLIMNLKALRNQNLYNSWIELSKNTAFNYPDQDVLNYTCRGRKLSIHLKYSFIPMGQKNYDKCLGENIFLRQEYGEAINKPTILHYAGLKPWNNAVPLGELWWKYAKITPFFDIFILQRTAPFATLEKNFYLFHFIPLLREKIEGNKIKYYLFRFIPFCKIKSKILK
ncbi:MAG: glycosyltransferase family 8 protein [Puniceicoccales bacterium]|jgi:lipopolysaccharide biosynthesis glycosyltransferase|nr:glycosyltransferase family 8 protein [Puniceicoccales bacterium]